jgi:hypothetical protein
MEELKIRIDDPEQGVANYEPLKAWALEQTAVYKSMIVDEAAIPEAKADVASLRKLAKAASDYRIKIKKEHEAKIATVLAQLTEFSAIFTDAAGAIDGQIKAFDETRKQQKREDCEQVYREEIGDLGELIPFGKLFNPAWLNKSTSMKTVRDDIQTAVYNAREALKQIRAFGSTHESEIIAAYLDRLNVLDALAAKERLEKVDAAMEARRKAEETAKKAAETAQAAQERQEPAPVEDLPDFPEETETGAVQDAEVFVFSVTGATPEQFEALVAFLEQGGYNYALEV